MVGLRKMINNATVFYNNNAAPIMQGCRIREEVKEMRAKALFSKFCNWNKLLKFFF